MDMKAAVFHGAGHPLTIEVVEIDEPEAHEVIVRTAVAGVCHTELHYLVRGDPHPVPAILGHEGSGVVEAVGSDVEDVAPGDHVVVCAGASCGRCNRCRAGRQWLCVAMESERGPRARPRITWDGNSVERFASLGCFAEKMLVDENALVKISKEIPMDRAALLSCGVLTGLGAVFNTASVEAGSSVAVYGIGGVGLAVIEGAAIVGAEPIIAVDISADKLARALELGATHTIDASGQDPVAEIARLTDGGVEYAFEAVGHPRTIEQAFASIRVAGTATVLGVVGQDGNVEIDAAEFIWDKKIQGSRQGSGDFRKDIPSYVDMYIDGRLHLDEMIARRVGLDDLNDQLEDLEAGHIVGRSLIVFDGGDVAR